MTVAHLTTVHPAADNRITFKEALALSEAGVEVILLARRGSAAKGVLPVRHVPLDVVGGRLRRVLSGYRAAWSALRRERPALVHIHDPELIPLAVAWKTVFRVPVVYDAHENLPAQVVAKQYIPAPVRPAVGLLARLLEILADRALSAVVIAEPALRSRFQHNSRVVLVQNFPWLRDFPQPSAAPEGPPVLAYVGAISGHRGIREMCSAAERSSHSPRLLLAGEMLDRATKETVEKCSSVDYRGRIHVEDIPHLLAGAHVGLCALYPLPNYVEAQSTKIFEYLAAGRPFVYSNFPAWVDMFGGEGVGIAIDPLDTDALTKAVDSLLDNPETARSMGQAGRKLLERRFTFEAEAPQLIALIKELLK